MRWQISLYSLILTIIILTIAVQPKFGSSEIISNIDPKVSVQMEIPDARNHSTKTADLTKLKSALEKLQPSKNKKGIGSNSAVQTNTNKPVDKTLLPNYQLLNESQQVGLVGVFSDNEKFVVLEIITFATGRRDYQKLSLNQEVMGFRLTSIEEKSAILTSAVQTINLSLFKKN